MTGPSIDGVRVVAGDRILNPGPDLLGFDPGPAPVTRNGVYAVGPLAEEICRVLDIPLWVVGLARSRGAPWKAAHARRYRRRR